MVVVVDLLVTKDDGEERHLKAIVSDVDVKVELLKNAKVGSDSFSSS